MPVAEQQGRVRAAVSWLKHHPGLAEFGIVGACLLVYFLIRGNVVDRPVVAFYHAVDVISFEKRFGFFWEPAWQKAIRGDLLQTRFWNYVYFWAHAPLIAAIAFWLYFRHRRQYVLIRNAFLVSAVLGLVTYAVYPVAPPRLMTPAAYQEYGVPASMPAYGFQDTMQEYSKLDYQAESLKPFVNPFAAMPSLHFGWAFLIGLAVVLALRNWYAVLFAVVETALMFGGVTLTANHFVFDAVGGLIAALIGLAVALAYSRAPDAWRRRLVPAFLRPSPPLVPAPVAPVRKRTAPER
jgi:hypothetical protein